MAFPPAKLTDLTFVSGFVTLAATTLATHFGALLGLGEVRAKAQAAATAAIRAADPANPAAVAPAPQMQEINNIQLTAAWVYMASLVFAVVMWGCNGFEAKYNDGIRNLAISLPGVLAGALAVTVNSKA